VNINGEFGSVGEQQFALWCEQAGLTASPPSRDRYGWDFVVQFPQLDSSAPIDSRPPQLKCMVQVKSTSRGARSARIKLDNWERMINDPLPWFVCAIVFDGTDVSELFLVHVDERYTERVLRRLRSLRVEKHDGGRELHKLALSATWGPEDAIVPSTPIALRDTMLRHIGTDAYGYGERKREWYGNVGYGEMLRTISAKIRGKSSDDVWAKIADLSLGLSDQLPIYLQNVTNERFGIPITELDLSDADEGKQLGHVSGPGPSTDEMAAVVISNDSRNLLARFRCQVFHSATLYSGLPEKFRRVRFACPSFELLMNEPTRERPKQVPIPFRLTFKFPPFSSPQSLLPLAEFGKIGRVLRCMAEAPENGMRVELQLSSVNWTLPDEIRDMRAPPHARPLSEMLEQAIEVASAFGLDVSAATSFAAICDQESRIRLMWAIYKHPHGLFPIQVPSIDSSMSDGDEIAIVLAVGVSFGDDRALCTFVMSGKPERFGDDGALLLREGDARILRKEILAGLQLTIDQLIEKVQAVENILRSDGFNYVEHPPPEILSQLVGIDTQ